MLLVIGSLLLLAFHVVPEAWGLTLAAAALALEIVEKGFWIRYTRRIPVAAGPEAMIGRHVSVISACRPIGRVNYGHESWKAYCLEGAAVGEHLIIDNVENTTLVVRRPRTARRGR